MTNNYHGGGTIQIMVVVVESILRWIDVRCLRDTQCISQICNCVGGPKSTVMEYTCSPLCSFANARSGIPQRFRQLNHLSVPLPEFASYLLEILGDVGLHFVRRNLEGAGYSHTHFARGPPTTLQGAFYLHRFCVEGSGPGGGGIWREIVEMVEKSPKQFPPTFVVSL